MTEKTKQRIHLIYGIILSAMLIIAGLCLIVACVGIYNSGDKPFTPDSVAAAFSGIAVPVYLCLALIVGGFVLDGIFPGEKRKLPVEKQYPVILRRLRERLDLSSCDPVMSNAIRKLQKSRKLRKNIALGLLILGSIVFLCYGLNPKNFHQSEITQSMENAMWVLLPCMFIPFGYSIFAAYYEIASIKKEITLTKEALGGTAGQANVSCPVSQKRTPWLRYGILVVAVVFLVYGFFAGGTNDVLTKAINICTECVGLG